MEKGFYNSELYFKKSCLVVKTLIKKGLVLGSFVKEVSSFMVFKNSDVIKQIKQVQQKEENSAHKFYTGSPQP